MVMVVPMDKDGAVVLIDDEEENNEAMKMPPPPKPVPRKNIAKKQATVSSGVSAVKDENSASQRPIRSTRSTRKAVPPPIVEIKREKLPDATLESVYEDAVSDDDGSSKPVNSTFIQPARPNATKFVMNAGPSDQTMTIQPLIAGEATFVTQNPTFNSGEPNNATFCMLPALNDETVVLEKRTKIPKQTSISSILTDDDSGDEMPLVRSKKPANEFIQ